VLGEIRRPEDLAPGYRGIPEPGSDAALVPAASVDVFAVPGVLFGRDGSRLGRGGGHYDRLLAEARPEALRVGVCYSDRVRAELPVEAWDQPVDLIITEQGVVGPLRGRPEPEVS
jgi:5-formyltetrahydrofolate cyclo-ligase